MTVTELIDKLKNLPPDAEVKMLYESCVLIPDPAVYMDEYRKAVLISDGDEE